MRPALLSQVTSQYHHTPLCSMSDSSPLLSPLQGATLLPSSTQNLRPAHISSLTLSSSPRLVVF